MYNYEPEKYNCSSRRVAKGEKADLNNKRNNIVFKKDGYGTFGNLSKIYDEIRLSMPKEIIDDFFSRLSSKRPSVLDLGCGTGIITRQLTARGAILTGTDIDSRMIEQAKQHQIGSIDYLVAPTEKLPLPDPAFDAATAFSAFHWFANAEAVAEIKRVLKNNGVFFIVNRNQVGEIRKEYLNILRSFANEPIPNAKKNYNPADILKSAGFVNVEEKKLPIIEYLTVEQSLSYAQSTSLWNLIPDTKKQEAIGALDDFFKKSSEDGFVQRPIEIQTVVALKA